MSFCEKSTPIPIIIKKCPNRFSAVVCKKSEFKIAPNFGDEKWFIKTQLFTERGILLCRNVNKSPCLFTSRKYCLRGFRFIKSIKLSPIIKYHLDINKARLNGDDPLSYL